MRSTSVGDTEMLHWTAGTDDTLTNERRGVARVHATMLGALYHVPPNIGTAWSPEVKIRIETLVRTTEFYGCTELTRVHITNFLASHRYSILKECKTRPFDMVGLGTTLEADWVLQEAATFIIARDAREKIPDDWKRDHATLWALLENKRARLIERTKDVELKLLYLRPTTSDPKAAHRAMDYFRHLLAQAGPIHAMKASYAQTLRQMQNREGPFDLTESVVKHYFGLFTSTFTSRHIGFDSIDNEWDYVLAEVRRTIAPLLTDVTALVQSTPSSANLRFMTIEDDELPWKHRK